MVPGAFFISFYRKRFFYLSHRPFHSFYHSSNYFAGSILFICRLHHSPGSFRRIGMNQNPVVLFQAFFIVFVVYFIFFCNSPAGLMVFFQFLQSLFLLLLGDHQEKFNDQATIFCQHFLKIQHFLFRNDLLIHSLIPALVKDVHPSLLRRLCEIPPEIRAHHFIFLIPAHGKHLKTAWIQRLDHTVYHRSFSRRIQPLKYDHDRNLFLLTRPLQLPKPHLQLIHLSIVFFLLH